MSTKQLEIISGRYSIKLNCTTLYINVNCKKKRICIEICETIDDILHERCCVFMYDRICSVSSRHADDIDVYYINNESPTLQMFSMKEYIYKEKHECIFSHDDMKKMIQFFMDTHVV
jgi:hypothetical protein